MPARALRTGRVRPIRGGVPPESPRARSHALPSLTAGPGSPARWTARLAALALLASAAAAQPPPAAPGDRIYLDSTDAARFEIIQDSIRAAMQRRSPPALPPPDEPPQSPAQARFTLASTLLSNGRVDEATAMLEDLYAEDPAALAVWLKLSEAYAVGRRYPDLVRLVDERIEREGPTVPLLARRGTALYRADQPDQAAAAWSAALAVAPDQEQTYRAVASEIATLRQYADAAAVLDQGRRQLGDDQLFLFERGHLYGLALDYQAAVDLYLELLAVSPEYRPSVQARLTRMLDGGGAADVFSAAIDRAAALDPLNRSLRELQSWLALERGDYERALDAVRALDRLEQERGESLLAFAVQAQSADAEPAAARALDEILERHPDAPVAPTAMLMRAQLWEAGARADRERADLGPTPQADAARDGYRQFLTAHPTADMAPAAALALADLLRDVFRDFDGSEENLQRAAGGRDQGVAARARLALGDVAVRRGDLDAARARFGDVDETIRIGPLAEQARYELALIDFYEGLMFSALARAEALDENTAADAANDAIGLRVTLNEVLDPDAEPAEDPSQDALHVYARAAYAHRQQDTARTLATLDSLDAATRTAPALADQSLFLRANALLAVGEAADAVAVLDRLETDYPDSYFLDRAYRLQAQAYEQDLDDAQAAAERYDRLLKRFPGSPLAPEARAELRRLRSPS